MRPYGDTTGDGRIQVSFTLPVPFGDRAGAGARRGRRDAARGQDGPGPGDGGARQGDGPGLHLLHRLRPRVAPGRPGGGARSPSGSSRCCPRPRSTCASAPASAASSSCVGACIGTDAHTVGIDAILNVKGHAGEKGLEYYREIRVVNLGSQVAVPDLVEQGQGRARGRGAGQPGGHAAGRAHLQRQGDVRGVHRRSGPDRPLLVVGGPRFDPSMAAELGVDKIFGRGTTPAR